MRFTPRTPSSGARLRASSAAVAGFLALGCGLEGCASLWSAVPLCPSRGGAQWTELTTRHFALVTDLDDRAARRVLVELESAYAALHQVAFPSEEGEVRPIRTIVFQSADEYCDFFPSNSNGIFMSRAPQAIENDPTLALFGDLDARQRRTVIHELTHRFIARAYGWVPAWMNEGLADYFSTMRVQQGRLILGIVVPERIFALRFGPPVLQLVSEDAAAFYRNADVAANYATAWALVHFFRNGPEVQRARFQAYIHAMNEGARSDQAWTHTIGAESADALERDFREYLAAWAWNLIEVRFDPVPEPPIEKVRALDDEETHLLWASLLSGRGPSASLVQAQLAEAEHLRAGSAEVTYARGSVALRQGRAEEAARLFREALARSPEQPRYLYGSVIAQWRTAGGGALRDPIFLEDFERLARFARSADQHVAVATILLERGVQVEAMRHVEEALKLEPNDSSALAARARIDFANGHFEDAVVDQEGAITFAKDEIVDQTLLDSLATYRRALPERPKGAAEGTK